MTFAFDFSAMLAVASARTPPVEAQPHPAPPMAQGSGILDRSSQRVGFALTEKALSALAPKGSSKCNSIMRTLDASLARSTEASAIAPAADALSEDARLILRARCGACPKRCATPLL